MVPNWKIQSSHARPAEQLTRYDNRVWQLWSGCHLCDSWHLQWGDQWIYLVLQRYATVACWINFRSSGSVHITVTSNTSFSSAIFIEHQVTVFLIQYWFPHLFILWMCTSNIFIFEHSRDLQCYKTIKNRKKRASVITAPSKLLSSTFVKSTWTSWHVIPWLLVDALPTELWSNRVSSSFLSTAPYILVDALKTELWINWVSSSFLSTAPYILVDALPTELWSKWVASSFLCTAPYILVDALPTELWSKWVASSFLSTKPSIPVDALTTELWSNRVASSFFCFAPLPWSTLYQLNYEATE